MIILKLFRFLIALLVFFIMFPLVFLLLPFYTSEEIGESLRDLISTIGGVEIK